MCFALERDFQGKGVSWEFARELSFAEFRQQRSVLGAVLQRYYWSHVDSTRDTKRPIKHFLLRIRNEDPGLSVFLKSFFPLWQTYTTIHRERNRDRNMVKPTLL